MHARGPRDHVAEQRQQKQYRYGDDEYAPAPTGKQHERVDKPAFSADVLRGDRRAYAERRKHINSRDDEAARDYRLRYLLLGVLHFLGHGADDLKAEHVEYDYRDI